VYVFCVQGLLDPLERSGVLVKRSTEELRAQLLNFTVIERETKVCGSFKRTACR
jgi:N-acetylglutamate synthase-like GNAT family acetyltransferase